MTFDEDWSLGSLTLADVCDGVALLNEGGGSFDQTTYRAPHRDGQRVDTEGPVSPRNLMLEVIPKFVNSLGTEGFFHVNLSRVNKELAASGLVALARDVENIGRLRAMVRQFAPATETNPSVFQYPLYVPSGSWQDASESSEAGNPPSVTTDGDLRIFDPILVFSAAGTFTLTASDGEEYEVVAASGPTYPVTVDVGAGTIVDNTGAAVRKSVTFSNPKWLRMEADTAQSIVTTVSCTVRWRNRWRF